ncbi:protease modulator HflC [Planctomycetota bacterium]
MKRRGIFSILVALLLVATLVTFLVSFQVRINERALVLRFGKVDRAIKEPGLYFKWPYPVETVQTFDTRMRVLEGKFQEVYTADSFNLIITLAVGWSIEEPETFYNRLQVESKARSQLESLVGGEMNAVVGRHKFEQFVSTDAEKLAFDQIETDIQKALATTAEERYGIKVGFVRITQLGLPEAVTERVFARMKAERNRIAVGLRAAGKSEADQKKAQADRDAQLILTQAEATATRLRGKGDAAAADAYKVFQKNEGLAIFLRKLDAIRKLKDRLTLIIDTRTPPWDLLRGTVDDILERHEVPKPGGKQEGR